MIMEWECNGAVLQKAETQEEDSASLRSLHGPSQLAEQPLRVLNEEGDHLVDEIRVGLVLQLLHLRELLVQKPLKPTPFINPPSGRHFPSAYKKRRRERPNPRNPPFHAPPGRGTRRTPGTVSATCGPPWFSSANLPSLSLSSTLRRRPRRCCANRLLSSPQTLGGLDGGKQAAPPGGKARSYAENEDTRWAAIAVNSHP